MMIGERDLSAPAIAVYFGTTGPTEDGTTRRRFPSTESAVRFIVEQLTVKEQVNASLIFDDGEYCHVEGIVLLYKRLSARHTEPSH